ncbi:MAG: hypothetical protein SF028_09370 [Candidatus Sumerlaeia bacterium]|nr:hypothetical protein [Candidatus Sumerlaeia bacterium]
MTDTSKARTAIYQEFDSEFQSASGLKDRRLYKIQYSPLHRFPLLALGDNPGGISGADDLLESSTFYEDGRHDIVEFREHPRYHIAAGMFALFAAILKTRDLDAIRRIPYLNVTFRRSQNKATLDLSPAAAALESASVLSKIITLIDPSYILITRGGFAHFKQLHLSSYHVLDNDTITTPNGSNTATIFETYEGVLKATGMTVPIAVVGHPSKYARRADVWVAVAKATAAFFERRGLREIVSKFDKK